MKRYTMTSWKHSFPGGDTYGLDVRMDEDPDGEWVKHADIVESLECQETKSTHPQE